LHLNGGRNDAERPRVQSAVECQDVRACAVVAALRADAAGEHVLRDVDLMFFAIDVSGGTHAPTRCILSALTRMAGRGQRGGSCL